MWLLIRSRQRCSSKNYAHVFDGDEHWQALSNSTGALFEWDTNSTYVQEPPFFQNISDTIEPVKDIHNAKVLVMVDDSITTDHISPAGNFSPTSPAGKYLLEKGVQKRDFNTYGARRGNHEVMVRGTFGNIRLHNKLTDKEGYYTVPLARRRADDDLRCIGALPARWCASDLDCWQRVWLR